VLVFLFLGFLHKKVFIRFFALVDWFENVFFRVFHLCRFSLFILQSGCRVPDEVRCVEMTMKHVAVTDEKTAAKTQIEKSLCLNVLAV